MKKARITTKEYDQALAKQLAEELKVSLPIAKLLLTRQIEDAQSARRFLHPESTELHDPFLLSDMEKATELILESICTGKAICVYGDYDVDGITATSLLTLFLRELGGDVRYFLPDRIRDGYGLNERAIREIAGSGVDLIITVDTGISAVKEAALARELGLRLVITDHHECQELLPQADAVIDPKKPDDPYPFKQIAGVGVAFKLACALKKKLEQQLENGEAEWVPKHFMNRKNKLPEPQSYLELVAIGTVADLMPLLDENRILVKEALRRMKDSQNQGLLALLEAAEIEPDKISSTAIGFRIGPRLNAAGRMGDASRGVELFLAQEHGKAMELAQELNAENRKRQEEENRIVEEALARIGEGQKKDKILVVAGEGWHHGVIGIVASRLLERFYRPVIVLTIEGEKAVGSARSVAGFNLFEALMSCKDLFIKFGGHEMAAGMTLKTEDLEVLRQRLNQYAEKELAEELLLREEAVDFKVALSEVTLPFIEEMGLLAPYGIGNPEPKFLIEGQLSEIRQMGKENQHLRLAVSERRAQLEVVAFFEGQEAERLYPDFLVKAAGNLQINEWNGMRRPQLLGSYFSQEESVSDFALELYQELQTGQQKRSWQYAAPTREDCKQIYLRLRRLAGEGKNELSWQSFPHAFGQKKKQDLARTIAGLAIFEELGICRQSWNEKAFSFWLEEGRKTELESSKIYAGLQR